MFLKNRRKLNLLQIDWTANLVLQKNYTGKFFFFINCNSTKI